MKGQPYHHENLKDTLIQAGIQIINEQGFEQLSMRKLAAACNVSHGAPYRHFKDKNQLLSAIQQHVENSFADMLQKALDLSRNTSHPMIEFGKAYVLFFKEHPEYYDFFTHQKDIDIVITETEVFSSYRPFEIFRIAALEHLVEKKVPRKNHITALTAMWSTVHGLAGMAIMPGVQYDGDWGRLTEQVLKGVSSHE